MKRSSIVVAVSHVVLLALLTLADGRSPSDKLESAINCFTFGLYKQLVRDSENIVSSPLSADVVLSSLLLGAGGYTAQELEETLGYKGMALADMKEAFKRKLKILRDEQRWNILRLENSIWIQNTYPLNNKFKRASRDTFFADVHSVDFEYHSRAANNKINTWVRNKTEGLVPAVFDQIPDPSTVMMLVNAMYFRGKWEVKFNTTRREPFHNHGSRIDISQVEMMTQRSVFRYSYDATLGAQLLEMDYEGKNLSMVILLPNSGTKFEDFEQNLGWDAFRAGLENLVPVLVQVRMPIFKLSSYLDLQSALERMGIQRAFDLSANLSGIAKNIYLTTVAQKAVFKVGAEGSEGAVASALVVGKRNLPLPSDVVYFDADRPFVFLVRHKPTQLVLFVGRITQLPDYF